MIVIVVSMAVGFAISLWTEPIDRARARILGTEGAAELGPLANKYGGKHSRFGEEWILRDLFQDRRDGTFLDVGAADYQNESYTFYLETALGWRGIAIDALSEYEAGYLSYRPRTKFFSLFVSDASDTTIDFYVPENGLEAASSTRSTLSGPVVNRKVPTITLNDLLERERITRVSTSCPWISSSTSRRL